MIFSIFISYRRSVVVAVADDNIRQFNLWFSVKLIEIVLKQLDEWERELIITDILASWVSVVTNKNDECNGVVGWGISRNSSRIEHCRFPFGFSVLRFNGPGPRELRRIGGLELRTQFTVAKEVDSQKKSKLTLARDRSFFYNTIHLVFTQPNYNLIFDYTDCVTFEVDFVNFPINFY